MHLNQVHKETLSQVENALPNRQGLEVEIFGMEGIPQDALDQHRNRIIQNFYQAQEDRRVATGNPVPGQGQDGEARKKIKLESQEEMLKRMKEFRKQKQAGADTTTANAVASGTYVSDSLHCVILFGGQGFFIDEMMLICRSARSLKPRPRSSSLRQHSQASSSHSVTQPINYQRDRPAIQPVRPVFLSDRRKALGIGLNKVLCRDKTVTILTS